MKICPACHQETFDGRRSYHRCRANVARVVSLELPSRDVATLWARLPFRSRRGALHRDLSGARVIDDRGRNLLAIAAADILAVAALGRADLALDDRHDGRTRRARLRLRWRPSPIPPPRSPTTRPCAPSCKFPRSERRRKSARSLVRDRWDAALSGLISNDRYALRR